MFRLFLIVIFSITLLFNNACNNKNEKEDNTYNAENKKIVAILPLTGKLALIGEWHKKGFLIAKEKIKNFELILKDNKSLPRESATIFSIFAEEKDTFGIISAFSQLSKPIIPLSDKYRKYTFLTTVSVPNVTNGHPNVYRYNINFKDEIKLMLDYFSNKNIKDISLIYINDEYGRLSSEYFRKNFKGRISFLSSFSNDTNEKNLLAKVPQDKPLVLLGYGKKYLNILKGIASIESLRKNVIITNYSLAIPQWKELLKNTKIKVVYTSPKIELNYLDKAFFDYYEKKYKEKPNLISVFSYDLLRIIDYLISENLLYDKVDYPIELPLRSAYGYRIKIDEYREIKIPIILKEEVL